MENEKTETAEHAVVRIETAVDVTRFVSQVMRTVGAVLDQDRIALGHAMTATVMFAVIEHARAAGDPMHPTEVRLTWEWIHAIWSRPADALVSARERITRIGSTAAIAGLALSAPGTAWAEIAAVEYRRRQGTIADWVVVDGGIRVIPAGTDAPKTETKKGAEP